MNTLAMAGFQAEVVIRDHQADPGQAPLAQAAQELGPERLVFAVSHRAAEHLTFSGLATPVATTTARDTTWPSTRPLR